MNILPPSVLSQLSSVNSPLNPPVEGQPWPGFCKEAFMPSKTLPKSKTVKTITTTIATNIDSPLQDPFGNTVIIAGALHNLEGSPIAIEGMYAAIQEAIRVPVLILEMQGNAADFYFYHKTDEENSLLVGTKEKGDHFTTTVCQKNPTPAQMSLLYKKAVRIR